jgi:hypothetical protein
MAEVKGRPDSLLLERGEEPLTAAMRLAAPCAPQAAAGRERHDAVEHPYSTCWPIFLKLGKVGGVPADACLARAGGIGDCAGRSRIVNRHGAFRA